MSYFMQELKKRQVRNTGGRKWVYVPYDQLSDEMGPLSRERPQTLGIILVESSWKARRRPYHKQKLALVLSNMRHFALEQASRGVAVRYLFTDAPYRVALAPVIRELGSVSVMEPAEYELRVDLQPLVAGQQLKVLPHEGWLTSEDQFLQSQKKEPPWRMDAFYRLVRQNRGILMADGKPMGGKYSFDAENRKAWPGQPAAPQFGTFGMDAIKKEVGELIKDRFSPHPGEPDLARLPASKADAQKLWAWAKREALPHFGPYEDAMSVRSSTLFHTRISSLLNLHRLLPAQVVRDVEEMDIPLASKEGFIRQVLGWREFMHHVHVRTKGFRIVPGQSIDVAQSPGDAGYQRWTGKKWSGSKSDELDGGAEPNALGCHALLPAAFWGQKSGLRCLDHVVQGVWKEGYSHHITRLMILANIATLLDISPRQLTDWFWVAYTDAYDWVVEPNVLGMGTFAVGDLLSTKPYVSGAAYINRMSDFCGNCAFDPKKNCPITNLYWAFLARHHDALKENPRMTLMLRGLKKRTEALRTRDAKTFERVSEALAAGEEVGDKLLDR